MIANAAWLAEGVLEALGWFFFLRRKVTALWVWLAFRFSTDLANYLIRLHYGQHAYDWGDYIQRNAQYALLTAVCVACSSQVLREHPKTRKAYTVALCVLALIGIGLLHAVWPPSADKVLLFEVGAELFLAGSIALAMGMANGRAPRPWGLIAVGLIVLSVSDAAVTMLARKDWAYWHGWYPVGAIPALGILCWAGWRDYRLEEARLSLPPKMEPTSVMRERKIQVRVQ